MTLRRLLVLVPFCLALTGSPLEAASFTVIHNSGFCPLAIAAATPVADSNSCDGTFGALTLTTTVAGHADYLSLGVYNELDTFYDPSVVFATPTTHQVLARMQDTFVVSGGTGTGMLEWTMSVAGITDCQAVACLANLIISSSSSVGGNGIGVTDQRVGPGAVTLLIPFDFDTQIAIDQQFFGLITYGLAPAYGLVDFNQSATLTGLRIFDSTGALVDGTVRSTSGFVYEVEEEIVPVPEPSSLLLLAMGGGLLGLRSRAVRRRELR
jgi:hypothetical protein